LEKLRELTELLNLAKDEKSTLSGDKPSHRACINDTLCEKEDLTLHEQKYKKY